MTSLPLGHTRHILTPLPFKILTNLLATAVSPFWFLLSLLKLLTAKGLFLDLDHMRKHQLQGRFSDRGIVFLCPKTDLWGHAHNQKRSILPLPAQRTHTASKSPLLNSGLGFIQCLQVRCQGYFINKPQPKVPYRPVCYRGKLETNFTWTYQKLCSFASALPIPTIWGWVAKWTHLTRRRRH